MPRQPLEDSGDLAVQMASLNEISLCSLMLIGVIWAYKHLRQLDVTATKVIKYHEKKVLNLTSYHESS